MLCVFYHNLKNSIPIGWISKGKHGKNKVSSVTEKSRHVAVRLHTNSMNSGTIRKE